MEAIAETEATDQVAGGAIDPRTLPGNIAQQQRWYPSDKDIATIAEICHEANRVLCATRGDLSVPTWADAPDWQKQSIITGVRFHMDNPHADARDSHDKWMETKLRDGWRYGPAKNVITKHHPCLMPYHALPDDEKMKDDLFRAIVRGCMTGIKRKAFGNKC